MANDVRLIDANKLLEELKQLEAEATNKYYQYGLQDAITHFFPRIIEKQPTIDTPPVKRGKWSECWSDLVRNVISVICSECENASITCLPIIILDDDDLLKKICIQMPYCPKCGARMEVGEDEQAQ